MANYSALKYKLNTAKENLNINYTDINNILTSLRGVYQGESATRICADIELCLSNLKQQIDYMNSLANTLDLIISHKQEVKVLNDYKKKEANWVPDFVTTEHDLNLTPRNPYTSKIDEQKTKIGVIEGNINNSLITISPLSCSINELNVSNAGAYKSYASNAITTLESVTPLNIPYASLDILSSEAAEWITDFQNPDYWTGGLKQRLRDVEEFPGASEFDKYIEEQAGNASPRLRAVTAAMSLIDFEHENHLTTRYILSYNLEGGAVGTGQPYTTEHLVNEGADCASFVSWALNKANPDVPFNNTGTIDFAMLGTKTDFASLKPGDILSGTTCSHVALVVCNQYEENGSIIVADTTNDGIQSLSNWTASGIRLKRYDKHALTASYQGRDLSSLYGEE